MKKLLTYWLICALVIVGSVYYSQAKVRVKVIGGAADGAAKTFTYHDQESHSQYGPGATMTFADGFAVTSGDIIVIAIHMVNAGTETVSGVTDDVSTSYTVLTNLTSSGQANIAIAYGVAGATDADNNPVITFSSSLAGRGTAVGASWTPAGGTPTIDVSDTQAWTWTTTPWLLTTGSQTTTAGAGEHELVVAMGGTPQSGVTWSSQTIIDVAATVLTSDDVLMSAWYLIRTGGEAGMHANANSNTNAWYAAIFASFTIE